MRIPSASTPIEISRILWVIDLSIDCDLPLRSALSFASLYGARLHLLPVLPGSGKPCLKQVSDLCWGKDEQKMRDLETFVARSGCAHTLVRERGRTEHVVPKVVEKYGIDLIIVGSHGRQGIEKLARGSVAEHLIRLVPCPVLTLGPHVRSVSGGLRYSEVLCAIDSTAATSAFAYALSMARRFQGSLTLLHVITAAEQSAAREMDAVLAETTDKLRALLPPNDPLSCRVNLLAVFGSAPQAIIEVAESRGAELIVMSVHERVPLFASTHFPWSTAHRVICNAPCPVLTIGEQKERVKEESVIQLPEHNLINPIFSEARR